MLYRYVILILIASSTFACSSSSGTPAQKPCNEDPWECPAGKVCWPSTPTSFECLISAAAPAGAACLDSVGVPTCADGLACLALGMSGGVCTPYCDNTNAAHACPSGQTCRTAEVLNSGDLQFHVCGGGTSSTTDAGGDNDAGASGGDAHASGPPDTGTPD